MYLIDTHCHLDVEEFAADRNQVLLDAQSVGVDAIIVPAIHAAGWNNLLAFCATSPQLYPALGLHPVYLKQHCRENLESLENLLIKFRPVAIGEIGLDYWDRSLDRVLQQHFFADQLAIAATANLPVILHVRKAHAETLALLRSTKITTGGIIHAFNGGLEEARRYIDLGFKLGFGGMLTFERSRKLRTLAQTLPAHAIVLETDAPDLTVASHRGERNSPAYLPECLFALAQVRNESLEKVADYTTYNACNALKLKVLKRQVDTHSCQVSPAK